MTRQNPYTPTMLNEGIATGPRKDRRGASVTALVLGIVAIALSPIPILNNASLVVGVIAVPFAIVGLLGVRKGTAVVGGLLAVAGLVITIALQIHWAHQLDQLNHVIDQQLNRP